MLKCFYTKQTKVALSKKVASKPVSRTYEEEGESQGYNNISATFLYSHPIANTLYEINLKRKQNVRRPFASSPCLYIPADNLRIIVVYLNAINLDLVEVNQWRF